MGRVDVFGFSVYMQPEKKEVLVDNYTRSVGMNGQWCVYA